MRKIRGAGTPRGVNKKEKGEEREIGWRENTTGKGEIRRARIRSREGKKSSGVRPQKGKRRNSGARKPKARERGSGENTNSTLDVFFRFDCQTGRRGCRIFLSFTCQEPITRSEQLPCPSVTLFSRRGASILGRKSALKCN